MPDANQSAPRSQGTGNASEEDIAEIARLKSRDDIVAFMTRVTAERGFPFFLLCTLPTVDQTKYAEISVITNVSADIIRRYDETGSLYDDEAFHILRTTTTPFRLTLTQRPEDEGLGAKRLEIVREVGYPRGYFFPVHNASGGRAVFILLSNIVDLPIEVMTYLHMICLHVYNRLVSIRTAGAEREKIDLSEREIQCLHWTAAGKTSSEIAEILGLSEHTVNHYLNHVAKKLDAVNRVQAVVNAMRLGLIS